METELKEDMHRQNAERLRRACDHRAATIEANILAKTERYEQRKCQQKEEQLMRQSYQLSR